jgi:hypothetical protein
MTNTNAQHLNYSPQIPKLRPEDLRNQSMLDRLTDHLNNLILIPGEGIEISRQGSAGTVLTARQSGSSGAPSSDYAGQFAVVIKAGTTNTVTIGAGRIVAGAAVSSIAATDHTPSGAAGTYYLYSESYFTTSWVHGYASSTTYPTQAVKTVSAVNYPCSRKLIAELAWNGSAVTAAPKQQQFGEIHIAGRWV